MTTEPTIRASDQIQQDCARKFQVVKVSYHFQAVLDCPHGEGWITPRLVEMVINTDGSRNEMPKIPDPNLIMASGDIIHGVKYDAAEADLQRQYDQAHSERATKTGVRNRWN